MIVISAGMHKAGSGNLDDFQKNVLHFNVGKTGRFRTVMEEEDVKLCNRHFSKYYEKLGYPPN